MWSNLPLELRLMVIEYAVSDIRLLSRREYSTKEKTEHAEIIAASHMSSICSEWALHIRDARFSWMYIESSNQVMKIWDVFGDKPSVERLPCNPQIERLAFNLEGLENLAEDEDDEQVFRTLFSRQLPDLLRNFKNLECLTILHANCHIFTREAFEAIRFAEKLQHLKLHASEWAFYSEDDDKQDDDVIKIGPLLRTLASAPALRRLNLDLDDCSPEFSGTIPSLSKIRRLDIDAKLEDGLSLIVHMFPKLTTLTVRDHGTHFSNSESTANPLISIARTLKHLTLSDVALTEMSIRKIITTPMRALKTLKLHYMDIQEGIITPFQGCFMPNLTALSIETNMLIPPDGLIVLVLAKKLPSIRIISIEADIVSPPGAEEEQRIRNEIAIAIKKLASKDVSLSYSLAYDNGSLDSGPDSDDEEDGDVDIEE
ncbi:hypothetical protein M422DRAFT_244807 [Sphaerobolus stellatus SS14]|nr:hypothetical protein M422DRAFT_244807 [Sphaerobolus stellatus SS14]